MEGSCNYKFARGTQQHQFCKKEVINKYFCQYHVDELTNRINNKKQYPDDTWTNLREEDILENGCYYDRNIEFMLVRVDDGIKVLGKSRDSLACTDIEREMLSTIGIF